MTGRAGKRKGFGWIPGYLKATFGEAWKPDSRLHTFARSQRPKQRDNKRGRQRVRRDIRNGQAE